MSREKPLLETDGYNIWLNKEGLASLVDAVDKLGPEKDEMTFPIFVNGNWHKFTVYLSDQEDFDQEGIRCDCGCQDEFADAEAKYE